MSSSQNKLTNLLVEQGSSPQQSNPTVSEQKFFPPPQSKKEAQEQQKQSNFYGLYHSSLYEELNESQLVEQQNKRKSFLLENSVTQNWKRESRLQIKLEEFAHNAEYLLLNVKYHIFNVGIAVFSSKKESECHKIPNKFKGSFANVYKLSEGQQLYAVKCTSFKDADFPNVFTECIKEVVLLKALQKLNVMPKDKNCFMFDLLIYSNCIEYCMEFCPPNVIDCGKAQKHLKQCLRQLHFLQITHCDIKPENIRFSPSINKWIFIDYGLHKIIKEKIGQKSFTDFRGSLGYCSKQMEHCYVNGDCFVDMFYNDVHCLQKTLKELKRMDSCHFQQESFPPYLIADFNELKLMQSKYNIIKFKNIERYSTTKRQILHSKLKTSLEQLNQHQRQQLEIFIFEKLFYSNNQNSISEALIQQVCNLSTVSKKKKKYYSFIFKKRLEQHSNQVEQDILVARKNIILNLTIKNADQSVESSKLNKTDFINILRSLQKANDCPEDTYMQMLTRYTQVTSFEVEFADKIKMLIVMHQKMKIKYDNLSKDTQAFFVSAYKYILKWLSKKEIIDAKFNTILQQSLPTALLFQIVEQTQMIHILQSFLLKNSKEPIIKIELFLVIYSSLFWLGIKHISIYRYEQIYDQVFCSISQQVECIQTKYQTKGLYSQQLTALKESKGDYYFEEKLSISKGNILQLLIQKNSVRQSLIKAAFCLWLLQIVKKNLTKRYTSNILIQKVFAYAFMVLSLNFKDEYFKYFSNIFIPDIELIVTYQLKQKKTINFCYLQLLSYQLQQQRYVNLQSTLEFFSSHFSVFSFYKQMIPKIKFEIQTSPKFNLSSVYQTIIQDISSNDKISLTRCLKLIYQQCYFYFSLNGDTHAVLSFIANILQLNWTKMFDFLNSLSNLEYYHNHSPFVYYHRFQIILENILGRRDMIGSDLYSQAMKLFRSSLSIARSMQCLQCRLNSLVAFNNNYLITMTNTEFSQHQQYFLSYFIELLQNRNFLHFSSYLIRAGKYFLLKSQQATNRSTFHYLDLIYLYLAQKKIVSQFFLFDESGQNTIQVNLLVDYWRNREVPGLQGRYFHIIMDLCKYFTITKYDRAQIHRFCNILAQALKALFLSRAKQYKIFFSQNWSLINEYRIKQRNNKYLAFYLSILLRYCLLIDQIPSSVYFYIWSNYKYFSPDAKIICDTSVYCSLLFNYFRFRQLSQRKLVGFKKLQLRQNITKLYYQNAVSTWIQQKIKLFRRSAFNKGFHLANKLKSLLENQEWAQKAHKKIRNYDGKY